MTFFPALYGKDSNGKTRIWQVEVVNGMIRRTTGLIDGKRSVTERPPDAKRKTPIEEQAAQMWRKQVKLGYMDNIQLRSEVVLRPMLLYSFSSRSYGIDGDIRFQPKLDGVRMLGGFSGGGLLLQSRNEQRIEHLTHLEKALEGKLEEGEFLDGELFCKDLDFEQITSAARGSESPYAPKLEFHCFDYFRLSQLEMPFMERYERLKEIIKSINHSMIKIVPAYQGTAKDADRYHDKFVAEGHEGVVIRVADSPYLLNKRSSQCIKYKKMMTEEFEIVGAEEAEGKDRGTPIWICETKDGDTFKARPKGTMESRRELWKNRGKLMGEMLTVQFQGLTQDGVPRFPVALAVRNYE